MYEIRTFLATFSGLIDLDAHLFVIAIGLAETREAMRKTTNADNRMSGCIVVNTQQRG